MGKMHATETYPTECWKVLEEKECHFYDENETAFTAVGVEIGIIISYVSTICGAQVQRSPVIRWMTLNEYKRLTKDSGVIIF